MTYEIIVLPAQEDIAVCQEMDTRALIEILAFRRTRVDEDFHAPMTLDEFETWRAERGCAVAQASPPAL